MVMEQSYEGNLYKKEIALVLTGDEFADGGEVIRTILHKK